MLPDGLHTKLHAAPFGRFRMHLTDGASYDIRHPESVLIGRRTAIIGVKENPSQSYYDRFVTVALAHIVRLEPIEETAAAG
jgi:hypothetical protein